MPLPELLNLLLLQVEGRGSSSSSSSPSTRVKSESSVEKGCVEYSRVRSTRHRDRSWERSSKLLILQIIVMSIEVIVESVGGKAPLLGDTIHLTGDTILQVVVTALT